MAKKSLLRMKKSKFFPDITACIIALVIIWIFRSDIILSCIYLAAYPYLILTGRKNHIKLLLLSTVFAIVWLIFSASQYGYNNDMLYFFGLPAFPLFAWAGGLFASILIYSHLSYWLKPSAWYERWALFLAVYWTLLIFMETVGYHVADVKNVATSMYPGLSVCNCMHAPHWMQAAYFLMGPLYFGIVGMILKKE